MTGLDHLVEGLKACHDAKDIVELTDIISDIKQLDCLWQRGIFELDRFINSIVGKHRKGAVEHDKGLPQYQSIAQRAASCREFLISLGKVKIKTKIAKELSHEAAKSVEGDSNVLYRQADTARRG